VVSLFVLLFACAASAQTTRPTSRPGGEVVPPPRRDVPGTRVKIASGELYAPSFFNQGEQDKIPLVLWFLGAAWCAEQNFYDARKNAVLFVANAKTLGDGFADEAKFDALLTEISAGLKGANITTRPIGPIVLVSFSGGYTAVRDLLRHEKIAARITDVVLLDSLYAPKIGENKDHLDPDAMAPFVAYARRAAAGETTFLFSHLYPPQEQYRGNTTTLAASFLIDALSLEHKDANARNSRGAVLLYRADKGNCHILGFAGMTNQDHFEHFYGSADMLRQTSLTNAPSR
jgi:hypothetical protein